MALLKCSACGQQVSDQANACPSCGHPLRTGGNVTGQVLALIGGGLMAASPFLPWATLGMLSASGLQKTGSEALIITALGTVGAIAAISSLSQKKPLSRWGVIVLGILGAVFTSFYTIQIHEQLSNIDIGSPALGIGIYASFAGTALLVIGGLAAPKQEQQPKPPTAKQ